DQTALDEILGVGELHAGVADGGAAVVVQQARLLAHLVVHHELLAGEQPPVAVLVGDDLDIGHQLGVPLDETADGGGQAGGIATGGQEGDALDGHGEGFPSRFGDTTCRVYRPQLGDRSRRPRRGHRLVTQASRGASAPRISSCSRPLVATALPPKGPSSPSRDVKRPPASVTIGTSATMSCSASSGSQAASTAPSATSMYDHKSP